MKETDLYPHIKSFFEKLGYEIKAEVLACDAVALKDDEVVIIELKTTLNLTVLLQGADRYALSDSIYIAIPSNLTVLKKHRKRVIKLMSLMGVGLLTVDSKAMVGSVDILCEPGPYKARKNKKRQRRLLKEFKERKGDPNVGGHAMTDGEVTTAYRQKASAIAQLLAKNGIMDTKSIRETLSEAKTQPILSKNYYGWFKRVKRGHYQLSSEGVELFKPYDD